MVEGYDWEDSSACSEAVLIRALSLSLFRVFSRWCEGRGMENSITFWEQIEMKE